MKLLKKNLHETANPSAVREKADKKKCCLNIETKCCCFTWKARHFPASMVRLVHAKFACAEKFRKINKKLELFRL